MRTSIRTVFLILSFCLSAGTLCQSTAATRPDIYANFVGTWVGEYRYIQDGVELTAHLRLEIKETKKKDALQCIYTFAEKRKELNGRRRRFTFHPDTSEMTSEWDSEGEDRHHTVGLDHFAVTGLGTFAAGSSHTVGGKTVADLWTLTLSKDVLDYRVGDVSDGKTYPPLIVTTLSRELSSSPTPAP